MKAGKWCYVLPVMGVVFGLWYVQAAFVDVVYSDYIRLVNSYLPDVWNPDKFFVGDILTRIPLNYGARIINTSFFDYRVRFDQILGILFLGISAAEITVYCIKKEIRVYWICVLMILMFSLNKWEMMINGSGWIHFLAFAGFYWHYLILDRVWEGRERKGDHALLLVLPWAVTLGTAGPYCGSYTAVLLLACGLRIILVRREEGRWERRYFIYGISALIPLFLYMWSSSLAEPEKLGVAQVPLLTQLFDTPGFFVRFLIKSFSSMAVGVESAQAAFAGNGPYLVLGILVMAGYAFALWLQWRHRLYKKTVFPLMLICAGGINHLLVMLSRWVFLREDYGMSSRYALQFQAGLLGVVLTFALAGGMIRGIFVKALMTVMVTAVLAGNLYTTAEEMRKAPLRKELCQRRAEIALDFENRTDEELRASFEYHMSRPEGGQEVRAALEILKKQQWNIFRQ